MTTATPLHRCNCLALRQAARHVTQFYDRHLAAVGLRTTQFSLLAKLAGLGPMTINALARELVMDRTTLGRTMLPLERDGLISVTHGTADRRSKDLAVTKAGAQRLRKAESLWREAQQQFEQTFGVDRAADLRAILGEVASCDLETPEAASESQRPRTRARQR